MSRVSKKCNATKSCTNHCATNHNHQNFKQEEVKFRVFPGPNSDKANLDLQIGFHCNPAVSNMVGTTCDNCWYVRKNTFGCRAVMSYENFRVFVENPFVKAHSIYDACDQEVLARIHKTRRDGVFHIYLVGCMCSVEDMTRSSYVYILTSKNVDKSVAVANIHLPSSKGGGKGCSKGYGKSHGKENYGISVIHTRVADNDHEFDDSNGSSGSSGSSEKKPTPLTLERFVRR